MKFLKDMIVRKKDDEDIEEQAGLSIEDLQRDLDSSGLNTSLRDPDSAWSEKAAQRPAEAALDTEEAAQELEWDEDLGVANAAPRRQAYDAQSARRQTRPVVEEEFDEVDGFEEFDEFDDEFDELDPEEEKAIKDNALLVDEIRDAIAAVRHIETPEQMIEDGQSPETPKATKKGSWEDDDVFGRKALARDQLARVAEGKDGDRILEETRLKMDDDDEASRRRLAMAHLKAAAAATKADSVLKRVVGRDPAMDLEQQVQYREDLANVVRQRGPRSEAISRPLSRPLSKPVSRPYSQQVTPTEPEADQFEENTPVASIRPEIAEAAPELPTEQTQISPEPKAYTPSQSIEPAEATMEVEKLDLKTALERQKAILKAEREALEAELAGETPTPLPDPEDAADEAFEVAEFEDRETDPAEPEAMEAEDEEDASLEAAFGDMSFDEPAEEKASELAAFEDATEESEDADWDEGTEEETEEPVDLSAISIPAPVAPPPAAEPVVEQELEQSLDLSEEQEEQASEPVEIAAAAPRRSAGRVKTRLLGFQSKTPGQDVFEGKPAVGAGPVRFPVGWLVVTKGEGFGHSFSLLSGVSKIGRGEDQAVKLDFGDTAISRDNHAAIAFDEELNQFFLGHGGKSNVVRLNGKPVLSTEELFDGDEIRIGETTLKFIALCSDEFTWADTEGNGAEHVASA